MVLIFILNGVTLKTSNFIVMFALFKPKWNIKYYLKWISTLTMQYCHDFNFSEQLAVRAIFDIFHQNLREKSFLCLSIKFCF